LSLLQAQFFFDKGRLLSGDRGGLDAQCVTFG